jgi:predicted transcriptional regulator
VIAAPDCTECVSKVSWGNGGLTLARRTLYLHDDMETLPVRPERLAQLEEFARRRGKSTAEALDDALADYLEWERQDYQEAVESVRKGYEDVKAGRTEPAEPFLDDFARKNGLPR